MVVGLILTFKGGEIVRAGLNRSATLEWPNDLEWPNEIGSFFNIQREDLALA